MGANQTSPNSKQTQSRNVSQSEFETENQRKIEQTIKEYVQNQKATRLPTQSIPQITSSPRSDGQSSTGVAPPSPVAPSGVPPPQPAAPRTNIEIRNANTLERQRSRYHTVSLREAIKQANSSLHRNLNDNGNSNVFPGNSNHDHTNWLSPLVNTNLVHVASTFKGTESFTPSARKLTASPWARSVSRSRLKAENGESNCSSCDNRIREKTFNCLSGHASCIQCRVQQRPCGICGNSVTAAGNRNTNTKKYNLEFQKKIPCLYKNEGCIWNFKQNDMNQHVKECPFKETQCFLPGDTCQWKGKLSTIVAHFDNSHPTHRGNVNTEMLLQLHNMWGTKRMQLIKIGNYNFLFHLIASEIENNIYIAIQLIGTKASAAKWNYEIHVYNKQEPRRKFLHVDKCFSSGESVQHIVRENQCAVLPLQYMTTFTNNGAIAYKYFIKKEFVKNGKLRDGCNVWWASRNSDPNV